MVAIIQVMMLLVLITEANSETPSLDSSLVEREIIQTNQILI